MIENAQLEHSMRLTSPQPFWTVQNGLIRTYPSIDDDKTCDVVIIGAGITGAMVAQQLAQDGHGVVVIDRRDVCTGSTAASTALLQYEIDLPLVDMATIIGQSNAERAYRISHQSIDQIESLIERVKAPCDFERKTSIYLGTDPSHVQMLEAEYHARRAIGFDVVFHDQASLKDCFGLQGTAALSNRQAACCDGYRLAHALLQDAQRSGARIYDRTSMDAIRCHDQGVVVETKRGMRITATHAIFASGYESVQLLREPVVTLDNTYALVSQPLLDTATWNPDWMLWEATNPYLYLRMTADKRLLVGGEDDSFQNPELRDRMIHTKAKRIEAKVRTLLPELDWETEFAWAGTFGRTHDGLAYIGPTPEYPHCYFALGFGGNGITFSAIATTMISKWLSNEPNPDADLFRFHRPQTV